MPRLTMRDIMGSANAGDWFADVAQKGVRFYALTEEGPRGIYFITSSVDPESEERRYTVRLYEEDALPTDHNCFPVGPIRAFSTIKKAEKAVGLFIQFETALCENGMPPEQLWRQDYPDCKQIGDGPKERHRAYQIIELELEEPKRCIRDRCDNPQDGVDGKCDDHSAEDYEASSFIDDGYEDEQALASAGWGTDESYE